ncbi:ribonuclease E inhibitor RraB [Stenotrophomonas sp.]|uniref:ribonuclease E inhibitor RraB n=1 Tax=Stenotrophomonas sp. TaxID=69392 RepID=UPI0028B132F4|nr:ribonuclease E inhibitor RraB [Stenotrophomonas sp.]
MSRDPALYPDDENGDVLWKMLQDGDDLSVAREVDFAVIFPDEDAALRFSVHLLRNEQKVSFSAYEGNDDFPWQVLAHPLMVPTHGNISGFEALLESEAARFEGRIDGWGCMVQD